MVQQVETFKMQLHKNDKQILQFEERLENLEQFNNASEIEQVIRQPQKGNLLLDRFNHTNCVDIVCYLCNWPS